MKSDKNNLRDLTFLELCKQHGIKEPEREFRFDAKRKWRFDYAFPTEKIAIEVEGGAFGRNVICNHCGQPVYRFITNKSGVKKKYNVREGMGHNTGKGSIEDMEKYNHAVLHGWKLLRFPSHELSTVDTIGIIKKLFDNNEKKYIEKINIFGG